MARARPHLRLVENEPPRPDVPAPGLEPWQRPEDDDTGPAGRILAGLATGVTIAASALVVVWVAFLAAEHVLPLIVGVVP